jgi:hypothetical protein
MAVLEVSAADRQSTDRPCAGRPYAGRNALNADDLRASIEARSLARGDAPDVRSWLLNHFWRHVVANFEDVSIIETMDDARRVLRDVAVPEWLARRFAEGTPDGVPLVWIDPSGTALLELEHRVVEFLSSRKGTPLEGKLAKVNCPQALALWEKEHDEMRTRIERGWRKSDERALRTVLEFPEGRLVEFDRASPLLRAEMAYESYVMRHCVGQFADRRALTGGYGEQYAQAMEQGKLRILSLRDKQGQPHVTISLEVFSGKPPRVEQVKGKQNRPPVERYADAILLGLNKIGTSRETPSDCLRIGIACTDEGWRRMDDITDPTWQARLVARYPDVLTRFRARSPLSEWIVAAIQPLALRDALPESAAVAYSLRDRRHDADASAFSIEGTPLPGFNRAQGATEGPSS